MNLITAKSWSGNDLVWLPSKRRWNKRGMYPDEECTEQDFVECKELTMERQYLVSDIQFIKGE